MEAPPWPTEDSAAGSTENNVEVRKEVTANTVQISDNIFAVIETKVSIWPKVKRIIGYVMMYQKKFFYRICDKGNPEQKSSTNGKNLCDKSNLNLEPI